jgi:hypothetical protein
MNARSRRRDLEINCLRIVAAQVELFRFHSAAIFTNAEQNFRGAVTTKTDDRFDIQSRADQNAARHVYARQLRIHWPRSVADANCEHGNIARAQFS